jgi:chromosome segregation protein
MENGVVQLENNSKTKSKELLQLQSEIQSTQMKIGEMTGRAELASKKLESESEEQDRKKAELLSKLSSLRATQEGMIKEMEIRKRDLREKESRCKEIEKTRKEDSARINELKRQVVGEKEEVARLEEKVSGFSKEIEEFFERIKNYEKELQEMGKQRGEKRIEFDKLNRDLGQLAVRKATVATRLEDVRAEFVGYREFEFLEGVKKDDLIRMISEAEQIISSMPSVNTAAIEMYDKKKAEIEGVEGKIATLGEERRAILEMIAEIEQHKNDAFFKTFYSVSDNFVKMFSYLNIGDGFLYMDKPNEPFESGLYIKIKRGNKEHSIDSLSGGENSLVALMFIFALQFFKPAPFYILDEVDAALDKENSKNLAQLISRMAIDTQFILVSHNDIVMSTADSVLGVAKAGGVSKIVGVKLEQKNAG